MASMNIYIPEELYQRITLVQRMAETLNLDWNSSKICQDALRSQIDVIEPLLEEAIVKLQSKDDK